ncbi:MAG TPA: hypothetical protein VI874_04120 [Candidatus Norongarragalinales archaeon]|nr:hypothetical protein [Candidatus Norongarragalinales archaeon]
MEWDAMAEFQRTLSEKKREFVLTRHAELRIYERGLHQRPIEFDLFNGAIAHVVEQFSENPEERKFVVDLLTSDRLSLRYVIAINSEIRVITLMKKNRQLERDHP